MEIYDHKEIEQHVQKTWEKENIIEKILNKSGPKYYLLDGPPYVNGEPHVGHVKTTTFKDIWGKFKAMQGFAVWWQPGFDCGGLPIENAVEKKMGITTKQEIEKNVDEFIEACKAFAKGNEPIWLNLYKKLGVWRGWLDPYLTSENYYLESGWWTIKTLYNKGLFVQGTRPGFWCSHCETVLSGYEVTDSYKDLEDPSIFVKFPVKGKKEYLLVWTTTPWTLPANVALCVHPSETYVKIESNGEILILAEKRLEEFEKAERSYIIKEKFLGKDLEGLAYEPLLDLPSQKEIGQNENAHKVVVSVPILKQRVASKTRIKMATQSEDEFGHIVDMETGSGIVHIAPGHGDIDNKLGRHYNLPEYSPVDERGKLTKEAGQFHGIYVKKADKEIIDFLIDKGLMFSHGKIVHSYPLCWRCKTPLIYRMSSQWFLKIDSIKQKMMSENKSVNWLPEFARERFHNMLEDAPDWAVTRQRYWGITLPIWVCEDCKSVKVVGSITELRENALEKVPDDIDLHKHSVDKIQLNCECGSHMHRIPDVMDVWFDSGISPWASLGYPYKNKELFESLWPADLIDESQDQIRGWFYYLMFCGVATFEEKPYKTVCLNGWTLDEKGEKMSKSLGNVIPADKAQNDLGTDVLRMYYCMEISPWETQKFSVKNAKEIGRQFNILWNTYQYFKTYCKKSDSKNGLRIEDEWILSKINSLIKSTTDNLENFNLHLVGRNIIDFIVNDFSRTYIKIIRDRYDNGVDYTLTQVFENVLKLMAPITPFISDYIYYDLNGTSVHLSEWPKLAETNDSLERDMVLVNEISNVVSSARKDKNVKLRWPINRVVVSAPINTELNNVISILCNSENVDFSEKEHDLERRDLTTGYIYVDTNVDEEKAMIREVTREIQKQRKEKGLKVDQRIMLHIDNKIFNTQEIKNKVGAKEIIVGYLEKGTDVNIEGKKVRFKFDLAS